MHDVVCIKLLQIASLVFAMKVAGYVTMQHPGWRLGLLAVSSLYYSKLLPPPSPHPLLAIQ